MSDIPADTPTDAPQLADDPPSEVDKVLAGAEFLGLKICIVVGYTDDRRFHFGSSTLDAGDILVALELARAMVVKRIADTTVIT